MATTSPRKPGAETWRRPDRRRVRAIRERLREMYGVPVNEPNRRPIDELVLTILSQHTNDTNSGRAFKLLQERFPTWDEVRDAPVGEVEDAIRPGGLAQQKAPRIQAILRAAGGGAEPRLDRDGAARGVARVPAVAARGGPQNGGLRAALQLGTAGDPGRRPHPPGRRPARALPGKSLARARPRRDAGDRPFRGRLRVPPQPDPPRPHALPPETALRRVRAEADVPLVPGPRPSRGRLGGSLAGSNIRAASP